MSLFDIKNTNTEGLGRYLYTGANSLIYPGTEKEGRIWKWGTPNTRHSWALKLERSWHILFWERSGREIVALPGLFLGSWVEIATWSFDIENIESEFRGAHASE